MLYEKATKLDSEKRIENEVSRIIDVSQWKLSIDREQVSKENVSKFNILKP
jgi:GH25 family lysozyme M1 (1,4-beta-N-acetylmuramidase)